MTVTHVPLTPRSNPGSSVWPIFLGLAGVLWVLAAVSLWVGRTFDARTDAARMWPTTSGVVVLSKASVVDYWDPKTRQNQKREHLDFAYTYEVGGRSYEGKRFDTSGAWPTGGTAKAFAADYPVGRPVQVHYNPEDPSRSGLGVEGPGQTLGFLLIAIGCGAVGLVFAGFGVRSLVRSRSAAL